MKKNDTLALKSLKPKKETIAFLLNYSKSLEVVKLKDGHPIGILKN
ncbi:hypothetical protein [Soonwooa sp.]|nr:hypothetical protein [Soonwooa sp.]